MEFKSRLLFVLLALALFTTGCCCWWWEDCDTAGPCDALTNPAEKCDCLNTSYDPTEIIVYFDSLFVCDSSFRDSNFWKNNPPVSLHDSTCFHIDLFLDSLENMGASVSSKCNCQEYLIKFPDPIRVTPKEAIAGAQSELKHTGSGAGWNYHLAIGPENVVSNTPYDSTSLDSPAYLPNLNSPLVGIVDMGLEFSHNNLKDQIWINPTQEAGCYDDGEFGYNTRVNNGTDIFDKTGHGTHIAGVIALDFNNSAFNYFNSIAPKILSVKITEEDSKDTDLYSAICGMKYAIDKCAGILNLSWGFYLDSTGSGSSYDSLLGPMTKIVEYARQQDVLLVCAAGNDGLDTDLCHHWPSGYTALDGYDNVISVAALNDDEDALADYSNYGAKSVDIAAPGSNICSTFPSESKDAFGNLTGTSMATPFVARAALIELTKMGVSKNTGVKNKVLQVNSIPINSSGTPSKMPNKKIQISNDINVNCPICLFKK